LRGQESPFCQGLLVSQQTSIDGEGPTSLVVDESPIKIKMKMKIRKRIRSKIPSKSRTIPVSARLRGRHPGRLSPALTLYPAPNPLPNLHLHPTLAPSLAANDRRNHQANPSIVREKVAGPDTFSFLTPFLSFLSHRLRNGEGSHSNNNGSRLCLTSRQSDPQSSPRTYPGAGPDSSDILSLVLGVDWPSLPSPCILAARGSLLSPPSIIPFDSETPLLGSTTLPQFTPSFALRLRSFDLR
jgi:hypothetical protein